MEMAAEYQMAQCEHISYVSYELCAWKYHTD